MVTQSKTQPLAGYAHKFSCETFTCIQTQTCTPVLKDISLVLLYVKRPLTKDADTVNF